MNFNYSEIEKILSLSTSAEEFFDFSSKQWNDFDLKVNILKRINSKELKNQAENIFKKCKKENIKIISKDPKDYPLNLLNISSKPILLYVKGALSVKDEFSFAIVGSRKCSDYGRIVTSKISGELSKLDIPIVSGMARGVDSAGQRGALEGGGESFAILGCGVDICYPRDAIGLYMDLQERGGVISEFPIGTKPLPKHFPARNRIISGLADAVLVIEAKEKSGSLITADMALEQGKDVYALPGPINSTLSRGCNLLIKQGADLLLSPEELLEEWGFSFGKNQQKKNLIKFPLESEENMVYSCLDFHPKNLEQLLGMTSYSVSELLDILVRLELKGVIKEVSKNYYAIVEEK